MGTDTKRSWKKHAALALAIFAALAGTFKLGYDTHKPQPKIEVRTQTKTEYKTKYKTQWKTKTITTTQTTPQTICTWMQRTDMPQTTKELGLSGWLALESTEGNTTATNTITQALNQCPLDLYAWGQAFLKSTQ